MDTLIILAGQYETDNASPAAKIVIGIIAFAILCALFPKNHDGK